MQYISARYRDLIRVACDKKQQYASASPFPHIRFQDFFDADRLREVVAEFPDLETVQEKIKFENSNEIKLGSKGEAAFGDKTRAFMHYLNSGPFLDFLQELTGIQETLVPDPYFEGGGFHEIKPGGFLKIHADFNRNKRTGLDRRLNLLVYLNENWQADYGGWFELWDRDMTTCVERVLPEFNTMMIFTTTDFSFHGHPDKLTCPPDRSRRSIALYYYSHGRPAHEVNEGLEDHSTLFQARAAGDDEMHKARIRNRLKDLVKDVCPPLLWRLAKPARRSN